MDIEFNEKEKKKENKTSFISLRNPWKSQTSFSFPNKTLEITEMGCSTGSLAKHFKPFNHFFKA